MAIISSSSSMQDILKQRKYPFIFSLFLLLIFVTFLLISNSQKSPIFASIDFAQRTALSKSIPEFKPNSISNSTSTTPNVSQSDEKNNTTINPESQPNNYTIDPQSSNIPVTDKSDTIINDELETFSYQWKLCPGPLAVDYIPCLDNFKAIKKIKSRRHMEHRERHCPVPTPRCLIPLPRGYKLPLPWPKSRDMVRFSLVWW